MELPGKIIKQCHSLSVGHMIDETAWQKSKVVSLTYCWS